MTSRSRNRVTSVILGSPQDAVDTLVSPRTIENGRHEKPMFFMPALFTVLFSAVFDLGEHRQQHRRTNQPMRVFYDGAL